jgi:hypothetical protein
VGTPSLVKKQLEQMAGELGIGELIVNTIVWEQEKRLRSYELLADVFGLKDSESARKRVSELASQHHNAVGSNS